MKNSESTKLLKDFMTLLTEKATIKANPILKNSKETGEHYGQQIAELFINTQIYITKLDSMDEFEAAVEPAIKYLLKRHHPHTSIYIHYDTAELLIREQSHNLSNEVPD